MVLNEVHHHFSWIHHFLLALFYVSILDKLGFNIGSPLMTFRRNIYCFVFKALMFHHLITSCRSIEWNPDSNQMNVARVFSTIIRRSISVILE